jgi:hypothetical protein
MQSRIFLEKPQETFVEAAFATAAKRCYHGNKHAREIFFLAWPRRLQKTYSNMIGFLCGRDRSDTWIQAGWWRIALFCTQERLFGRSLTNVDFCFEILCIYRVTMHFSLI